MDVVSWRNGRGVEFKSVHFLDEGTLFQQGVACSTDTDDQIRALEGSWISWAGPPKEIYTDPAKEYTSEKFLENSKSMGSSFVFLRETATGSWVEQRCIGQLSSECWIEWMLRPLLILGMALGQFWLKLFQQRMLLSRVKGFTPEQAVSGISRRLPASICWDGPKRDSSLGVLRLESSNTPAFTSSNGMMEVSNLIKQNTSTRFNRS